MKKANIDLYHCPTARQAIEVFRASGRKSVTLNQWALVTCMLNDRARTEVKAALGIDRIDKVVRFTVPGALVGLQGFKCRKPGCTGDEFFRAVSPVPGYRYICRLCGTACIFDDKITMPPLETPAVNSWLTAIKITKDKDENQKPRACYKGGGQGHIKEPRGAESAVRKILKALYATRDYENLENRLGPQLGDLVKLVISHCDRMETNEVSSGK